MPVLRPVHEEISVRRLCLDLNVRFQAVPSAALNRAAVRGIGGEGNDRHFPERRGNRHAARGHFEGILVYTGGICCDFGVFPVVPDGQRIKLIPLRGRRGEGDGFPAVRLCFVRHDASVADARVYRNRISESFEYRFVIFVYTDLKPVDIALEAGGASGDEMIQPGGDDEARVIAEYADFGKRRHERGRHPDVLCLAQMHVARMAVCGVARYVRNAAHVDSGVGIHAAARSRRRIAGDLPARHGERSLFINEYAAPEAIVVCIRGQHRIVGDGTARHGKGTAFMAIHAPCQILSLVAGDFPGFQHNSLLPGQYITEVVQSSGINAAAVFRRIAADDGVLACYGEFALRAHASSVNSCRVAGDLSARQGKGASGIGINPAAALVMYFADGSVIGDLPTRHCEGSAVADAAARLLRCVIGDYSGRQFECFAVVDAAA